eukprot:656737-Prorocentrum_minimum.AAC.2
MGAWTSWEHVPAVQNRTATESCSSRRSGNESPPELYLSSASVAASLLSSSKRNTADLLAKCRSFTWLNFSTKTRTRAYSGTSGRSEWLRTSPAVTRGVTYENVSREMCSLHGCNICIECTPLVRSDRNS